MLTSAEQVLSAAWSGPVRLDARDPRGSSLNGSEIRRDGSARAHSRVMRCSVLASPQPAPATVIVKSFQECAWKDWKGAYDPNDAQQGRTAWRFFNEWAWMQFVERLSCERPLGPRLYGGDRAAGLMVMEDLGEGGCLADLLFGADPVRAKAGLVEAAATLGQLHAASLGRAEEYRWSLLSNRPMAEDLKEDRPWGHASMRQRRLLHLDAFATLTEEFRHLEVLGGLARALATRLRTLWEFVPELPLYPAFRCKEEQTR
jgi:hypothetical protein